MHHLISRRALIALLLFLCAALPSTAAAQTETDPVTGMEFVTIPGGTFVMGGNDDEVASPEHEVTVSPFYMSKFEVTFDQFAKYTDEFARDLPDDEGWGQGIRPVINVNWHEAQAFVQWLSKKTGKAYRLPTEAEWEYAARGGTTSQFPWGDELGRNNATCRGCGSKWDDKMTAPVGSFAANGFGLFDMAGNVYEWTLDTEHRNYVGAPSDGSAWIEGPEENWYITRGGSWNTDIRDIKTYIRCWDKSSYQSNNVGLRVVLEK